jgi:hypothetical protein
MNYVKNTAENQTAIQNQESQNKEINNNVQELYDLLGAETVLLPIKLREKAPNIKEWTKLEFGETQNAHFQKRLLTGNIGVVLGEASNNLCSIDCDKDEVLQEFLTLNPDAANTLITKGKRGGNVWFRFAADTYPQRTLKVPDIGEFRSNGGQTVICGQHPDGMAYKLIQQRKVININFKCLKWPKEFLDNENFLKNIQQYSPLYTSTGSQAESKTIPQSISLSISHKKGEKLKKLAAIALNETKISSFMKDKPELLKKHYQRYIADNFVAVEGSRNAAIVHLAPILVSAVHEEVALKLLMAFYEINKDIFNDSAETHEQEAERALENSRKRFHETLTDYNKQFYAALNEFEKSAFRILFDLARASDGKPFPLSANELAERLGLPSCNQGGRILKKFEKLEIIKINKKGAQHTKANGRGLASTYEWDLDHPNIKSEEAA